MSWHFTACQHLSNSPRLCHQLLSLFWCPHVTRFTTTFILVHGSLAPFKIVKVLWRLGLKTKMVIFNFRESFLDFIDFKAKQNENNYKKEKRKW